MKIQNVFFQPIFPIIGRFLGPDLIFHSCLLRLGLDFFIRGFQSAVFNRGQKLVLKVFYVVICQSYYEKSSQRYLFAVIENNWLEAPMQRHYEFKKFLFYKLKYIQLFDEK